MSYTLALSSSSGKIWKTKAEKDLSEQRFEIDYNSIKPSCGAVRVVMSESGDWVVVSDTKGSLTCYHLARNKFAVVVKGCTNVNSLAIIDKKIDEVGVSCSNDIEIYQVIGKLVCTLKGHKQAVLCMQSNNAKKLLVSCSTDVCILWNTTNWTRERSLYSKPPGFVASAFIDPINALSTLDHDGLIMLWDLTSFEPKNKFQANDHLTQISFSSDGQQLLAVSDKADIIIWNTLNSQTESRLKHNPLPISAKWCSKNMILVLGVNNKLYITDTKSSKVIGTVPDLWNSFQVTRNGMLAGVKKNGNVGVVNLNLAVPNNPALNAKTDLAAPSGHTTNATIRDEQLKKILYKFGEYPDKHRITIWKSLLKIPINQAHFDNLLRKGEHPSIELIQKQFPIKDDFLMQNFIKIMSALAFWCPILGETDFFPAIVFPFVKLGENDLIGVFEIIVSIVLNWLNSWFENFPQPPVSYLILIEDMIKTEEPKLVKHLTELGINVNLYIWPIVKYLFTQVVTKEEFCVLIDHIFTHYNRPDYLVCVSAGYIIYFKSTLLAIRSPQEIQGFLVQQNPINVIKLIKLSSALLSKSAPMQSRIPIPDEYPVFSNYPDFALTLQTAIRERLIQQDQEIQMKKKYIEDINKKFIKLEEDDLKFRREQETLIQAENERRKVLILEEDCRLKEKQKLDSETKRIRLLQIQRIEQTIENSLKSQEALRKQELESIEQEIHARSEAEKYYNMSKQEDESLSLLEFKAAQRLLELMRVKNAEESMRRLKINSNNWEREQHQKERLLKSQWDVENEQRRLDLEMMRETKLKELEMTTEYNNKRRIDTQQHLKTLERELRIMDLEKERQLRLVAEEERVRNEEYLAQLKIKQELMREYDEKQFQILLTQEKEYKMKSNNELLKKIKEEQEKQAVELQRQREENERLERELEKKNIDDKILQMRLESEVISKEKEKLMQETLLKIEEDRRNQRKIQQDLENRRRELKERNASQKVLRDNMEEAIQKERENFIRFKEEINRENANLEHERKKMHEKKMNEILKQREETLVQISSPMPQPQFKIKERIQEFRNFSEEELEPRYKSLTKTEESPYVEVQDFKNDYGYDKQSPYKYSNQSGDSYEDLLENNIYKNSGVHSNLKPYKSDEKIVNFDIKEQFEDSFSSSNQLSQKLKPGFEDRTNKNFLEPRESEQNEKKTLRFKENPPADKFDPIDYKIEAKISEQKDFKTEKLLNRTEFDYKPNVSNENLEYIKQAEDYKYKEYDNFKKENPGKNSSIDSFEFKTHPDYKKYEKPDEKFTSAKVPKDGIFDLNNITNFNAKKNTLISKNPPKNFEKSFEDSSSNRSSVSQDKNQFRKKWDNESDSKYSEYSHESSLSYDKLEQPKPDRFFISKTQKPDVNYSARWDEKSENCSSCRSYECSSCVYSSSERSSECSCESSGEESPPPIVPGHYHYSSSEYSQDSYVRRSNQL
jgi:Rab-GTPase-TBC domain